MTKRRISQVIGLTGGTVGTVLAAALATSLARAQIALPTPRPPDGASLFKQQCATCHTTDPTEPPRVGPSLHRIIGRPAGKDAGFAYSPGLAKAGFVWDESKLDAWLTDPQAMIPDAIMVYRQAKPETRAAIIAYIKELN